MRKSQPILVSIATLLLPTSVRAQDRDHDWDRSPIRHVLLISVDGMHAADFLNCSHGIAGVNNGAPYCPNLAVLGTTGVNYVATSTSRPSDSFPGLMTLVSSATPRTLGVHYDVAYDRTLDGPMIATGNGNPAETCTPGVASLDGYETEYEEGIDIDQTRLNGGAPGASLTDWGDRVGRHEEAGSRSGERVRSGDAVAILPDVNLNFSWQGRRAPRTDTRGGVWLPRDAVCELPSGSKPLGSALARVLDTRFIFADESLKVLVERREHTALEAGQKGGTADAFNRGNDSADFDRDGRTWLRLWHGRLRY